MPGEVIPVKLSEFPPIGWHDRQLWTLKTDGKLNGRADRVQEFAHALRVKRLDCYGDWNIRDVSIGSACLGTVVATLSGKLGRVEVWNNGECYVIPKGGEPVQVESPAEACALAGIAERLPLTC